MKAYIFVHVQPEVAICQEGNDEPDEQRQRNKYGDDEVAHLIAQVHEYTYDVHSFKYS